MASWRNEIPACLGNSDLTGQKAERSALGLFLSDMSMVFTPNGEENPSLWRGSSLSVILPGQVPHLLIIIQACITSSIRELWLYLGHLVKEDSWEVTRSL